MSARHSACCLLVVLYVFPSIRARHSLGVGTSQQDHTRSTHTVLLSSKRIFRHHTHRSKRPAHTTVTSIPSQKQEKYLVSTVNSEGKQRAVSNCRTMRSASCCVARGVASLLALSMVCASLAFSSAAFSIRRVGPTRRGYVW